MPPWLSVQKGTPAASAAACRPLVSWRVRVVRVHGSRASGFLSAWPGHGRWPRVATEGARLGHAAQRGPVAHHRAFATEGHQRHAAADPLAHHRSCRARNPESGWRTRSVRCPVPPGKAGHHFVRPAAHLVLRTQLAAAGHEGTDARNKSSCCPQSARSSGRRCRGRARQRRLQSCSMLLSSTSVCCTTSGAPRRWWVIRWARPDPP